MKAKNLHTLCRFLLLLVVAGSAPGCGQYVAHRMLQAPNSYPTWLAPKAPVTLVFEGNYLTNFPSQFAEVGQPRCRLHYRIVEPADYQLRVTSTNWLERDRKQFQFRFHANVPGPTNAWTHAPRGTVVLLHGYGVADFAMAPWALQLAQRGWRCVLVDLRGHGKSTGDKIYFGVKEPQDMSELLDVLTKDRKLTPPVAAVGESYGASLALRWKAADPRVDRVVAFAPYAVLSNAVLNICREYARWLPAAFPKAGLKKLPAVMGVQPHELDPVTILRQRPVPGLFVVGGEDRITPSADVQMLFESATPSSQLLTIPDATHETVPYFFEELTGPVLVWLGTNAPNSN